MGLPYSKRWIQELRDGILDALVALLLAQLSNLRYLYLSGDLTRRTELIGMVLQSAICEDYGLPDFFYGWASLLSTRSHSMIPRSL
jgi:hypothetical protein